MSFSNNVSNLDLMPMHICPLILGNKLSSILPYKSLPNGKFGEFQFALPETGMNSAHNVPRKQIWNLTGFSVTSEAMKAA